MVKIFTTGATGYIGGDALFTIVAAHPEYEITALVRNSDKGALVAKQYPKIKLVYGDLDSFDLIAEESAKADIVCNFANCDHESAANAIKKGQSTRQTQSYIIHTSGTGILCVQDASRGTYGTPSAKIYNDWDGIDEVTSLPDTAWHRNVDKIILSASASASASDAVSGNIKTAIVCPPTIYGPGRGPGNTYSDQWYLMTKAVLQRGRGFQIGKGENMWNMVHVHDLSNLYLRLVEEAASGGGAATWNQEGYYFAENGEYVWGDVAAKIAREACEQGFIGSADVEVLDVEEGNRIIHMGGYKWGFNSRCRAVRARKLFGWTPVGKGVDGLLPAMVRDEARKLGLVVGHAVKAAGDA